MSHHQGWFSKNIDLVTVREIRSKEKSKNECGTAEKNRWIEERTEMVTRAFRYMGFTKGMLYLKLLSAAQVPTPLYTLTHLVLITAL